ncbi:thiamine phosphate synthase [Halomarina halobia]|uniref:Thiamine-phosphate synthase n=1 Tax=Halomarina halobia TaxID=3033386 RepID=A0ABD6A9J4_9EURY|nr:thiamine phosphate synthase [Halomarina sp. PSR21]
MNPDDLRVYLVTQESLSAGRTTPEVVAAALDGGATFVQLREKGRPARERYEVGLRVRELTAEAGVPFVVNDRVDLALALDADGVHLGDEDLPVSVARDLLGPEAIVGRSASSVGEARAAREAGADYLGVGAVFATGSKDVAPEDAEIGLERVREIAEAVDLPLVGIGGVTAGNAADVLAAGADGVAVISAITGATDVREATRALADEAGGENR